MKQVIINNTQPASIISGEEKLLKPTKRQVQCPFIMKQIRVLRIVFDNHIASFEIPAFRAAIAQKAGLENTLFHNHERSTFRYQYPLIQYKRMGGKAAIVCLDEGVDEVHKFFSQRDWTLHISGREIHTQVDQLDLNSYTLKVEDRTFIYRISNWIGVNQKSYPAFKALKGEDEKKDFLAKKLIGNILSFAKGVGWHIEDRIELKINHLDSSHLVKLKGIPLTAHSLVFSTNVQLPMGIGLGKSVSLGYGVLYKKKPIPRVEK
jgi:hypothetical protein